MEGAKKEMKKVLSIFVVLLGCLFFFKGNDVYADSQEISGQPVEFNDVSSIDEVVTIIDNYYSPVVQTRAAAGTKWKEGTVKYIGQGSHLVTNYFWVKGSSMSNLNVVGKAQRKAVIAKYGKVNNNTSYKMKTEQKINMSPQTQGYVTVSAQAWCYAKD
ncbi:hypothetical protein H6A26_12545 [Enterococcus gallinarum]|nr:hypothetical protein [Enterococcus gallinarum]OJG47546.1 hypothetical protein RV03_GL002055 [Enterococcus gallinarum]